MNGSSCYSKARTIPSKPHEGLKHPFDHPETSSKEVFGPLGYVKPKLLLVAASFEWVSEMFHCQKHTSYESITMSWKKLAKAILFVKLTSWPLWHADVQVEVEGFESSALPWRPGKRSSSSLFVRRGTTRWEETEKKLSPKRTAAQLVRCRFCWSAAVAFSFNVWKPFWD